MPNIPLPGRFRPLYIMSIIYLGISFLLRLVLWKLSGFSTEISGADLVLILGMGIMNDCATLLFLNIPALLYLTFLPDSLARHKGQRIGFALLVFFSLCTLLCLVTVESIFFQRFNARFNLMAVDYLIAPSDLLTTIWKSYPVIWILLMNGLLAALILFKSWPAMDLAFEQPAGCKPRLAFLAGYLLLLLPALWISTNSSQPSDTILVNEMAHNGLHSLFKAFHSRYLECDPVEEFMNHDHHCKPTQKPKRLQPTTPSTTLKLSESSHPRRDKQTHAAAPDTAENLRPILGKIAILTLFYKGSL